MDLNINEIIDRSPQLIQWVPNPPEDLQIRAVQKLPWVIRLIDKPNARVQLAACQQDPEVLSVIKSPHPFVVRRMSAS
jgi:hypothetical protein